MRIRVGGPEPPQAHELGRRRLLVLNACVQHNNVSPHARATARAHPPPTPRYHHHHHHTIARSRAHRAPAHARDGQCTSRQARCAHTAHLIKRCTRADGYQQQPRVGIVFGVLPVRMRAPGLCPTYLVDKQAKVHHRGVCVCVRVRGAVARDFETRSRCTRLGTSVGISRITYRCNYT